MGLIRDMQTILFQKENSKSKSKIFKKLMKWAQERKQKKKISEHKERPP